MPPPLVSPASPNLAPLPPLVPNGTPRRPADEQREWLRNLFDETAPDYNRLERWLSLGSGRWYRRQALRRAGLDRGMTVLDVATGTGLVAVEAAGIVGDDALVTGVDPSEGMLTHVNPRSQVRRLRGWAHALPVPPTSFDFLSLGYALRHLEDLRIAFREFSRVLKPGGRVCILEITRPRGVILRAALRGYLWLIARAASRLGRAGPRTGELWRYYWQTIDRCVPPQEVVKALEAAGFHNCRVHTQLGLFTEYLAEKSDTDCSPPHSDTVGPASGPRRA